MADHSHPIWLAHWFPVCCFLCAAQPMRCMLWWLRGTDQLVRAWCQATADLCPEYGSRKVHVLVKNTLLCKLDQSF